ncbi:MAG: NADH-quinone oxidoreductase subunit L [Candidatus Promineifilaceae bacterium]|jgi:NADH-quinone oxidoreductase subunit L
MLSLLWLIPVLPFVGFLILTVMGGWHRSQRVTSLIGVGSVGLAVLLTGLIAVSFVTTPPPDGVYVHVYWTWFRVVDFAPKIALHLDSLSLLFILVITFVGFFIHVYSAEFMAGEDNWNYARFFSYLNLFIAMMLVLVLAENMLLLYLGWEGVGLCSFLLIGFWYKDPKNGRAARKAFVVTRIGDAALAVSLFLLFDNLGTLDIQLMMTRAAAQWPVGSMLAVWTALMLLGGAVGKSAQLPLQIWLPDAMAGPTPVSALIHAATMVTAGVYLIARANTLFLLAPSVMVITATIGALTLLMAGFSALTQWDIKRVLAYSTISQLGYMFLALGVGAWSAAIFHFMTHAFFKSLLFLSAGVIISRLDDEHDMFKMGGLRKELPFTFWAFLIGGSALAAMPLITSGFYSKDKILADVWASPNSAPWLWVAGIIGALLTGIYTFRMIFLTFFGKQQPLVQELSPLPRPGWRIKLPLAVLSAAAIFTGFVETPPALGNISLLSNFLNGVLPPMGGAALSTSTEMFLMGTAIVASLAGVAIAYYFILKQPQIMAELVETKWGAALHRFWFTGWGFDWLDNHYVVQPFVRLAQMDKDDWVDMGPAWITEASKTTADVVDSWHNGRLRRYAGAIVLGAVLLITAVIMLR